MFKYLKINIIPIKQAAMKKKKKKQEVFLYLFISFTD